MKIGHHQIPRSRGGSNHAHNILRVEQKEERKMHDHYGIKIAHEKILDVVDNWDKGVIAPEARKQLKELLCDFGPDFYRPQVFRTEELLQRAWHEQNGILVPS